MRKKNKCIIPLLCTLAACALAGESFAQPVIYPSGEVVLEISRNTILEKKYHEIRNSTLKAAPVIPHVVTLPFFDDFSKESIYPDPIYWLDSNAFINRDYPIAPPSMGVATLDGVSKTGCPYDTLLTGSNSYPADTLTSQPINLLLSPSDSIYLSFYWQAEGRGNDPEASDTLLLQFRNPSIANDTTAWKTVWYMNGYNPVSSDTSFKLVTIGITDTAFLKSNFQFRFRNYATVSGNVDHWHIDYVLLDKNRSKKDTIFSDVAFAYNTSSLLKNYYAMPSKQYVPTEMKTNLSFFIRNNDSIQKSVSMWDTIYNSTGTDESSYGVFFDNLLPYYTTGLWTNTVFASPPISTSPPNYMFPALTKDSTFLLKCVINASADINRWNDTLRFRQVFSNYYAYDDGTTEAGYGLNFSGGQVAYKFTLNVPDSLYALYMLFNWVGPNVNQQQFKIRVWNDNAGSPGSVIYEDVLTTPNYQYVYQTGWGNLTNMYYPYLLKTPPFLSGTFYVGFIQYTNPVTTLLNLGLDKNTDARSNMYYNAGSGWNQSSINFPCSWMIRPVFGSKKGLMTAGNEGVTNNSITLYPNPSKGIVHIGIDNYSERSNEEKYSITVFSITGQVVYSEIRSSFTSPVDLTSLTDGLYFIRIGNGRSVIHQGKISIIK